MKSFCLSSIAALAVSGAAFADPTHLVIDDFIGTVSVERGSGLSYDLDMRKNLMDRPDITQTSDRLTVDGLNPRGPRGCRSIFGSGSQMKWKGRYHPIEDFPHLTIRTPDATVLKANLLGGELKSVDLSAADISVRGCGDVHLRDVAGHLKVAIDGSGDVIAKNTGSVDLAIDGSGDIEIDTVDGPATAMIDGSGDIEIERVTGQVMFGIDGSGDIHVDGGQSDLATLSVNGSGDITFDGEVTDVSVLLNGSGDVYVARSTGEAKVKRHGSGDVRIGKVSYDSD